MTDLAQIAARLDSLESHIAHQESLIDELSDIAQRQWKEIEALGEKLGYLKGKLEAVEDGLEAPPGGEPPPPHY